MRSLVEHSGRPLSMTVQQVVQVPDRWREMAGVGRPGCVADGLPMRTQVAPAPGRRAAGPPGVGEPDRRVPVVPARSPTGPLAENGRRAARSRSAGARIVDEHAAVDRPTSTGWQHDLHRLRQALPDDRPGRLRAVGRLAASPPSPRPAACRPVEEVIDLLLEDDGHQLLYMTLFNYAHGNLDDVREMLLSPNSVIGLGDAGAHCGAICDASFPTTAAVAVDRAASEGAADRADGPPPDAAHGPPGRLARPRRRSPPATSATST